MNNTWWRIPKEHDGLKNIEPNVDSGRNRLDILVREVIQNSKDQRIDDKNPVKMRFQIEVIKGAAYKEFKENFRLKWLQEHLKKAKEETAKNDSLNMGFYDEKIFNDKFIVNLYVHDTNTTGVWGKVKDKKPNPWKGLVWDIGQSADKPNDGSGGSFGYGKNVLWRNSKYSTVLISSRLPKEKWDKRVSEVGFEDDDIFRFISTSRSVPIELTDEEILEFSNKNEYSVKTDHPRGYYFKEVVYFPRSPQKDQDGIYKKIPNLDINYNSWLADKRGTSLGIIGIDINSLLQEEVEKNTEVNINNIESKVQLLKKAMSESIAKWWWPAIADGEIEVEVTINKTGNKNSKNVISEPDIVNLKDHDKIAPFVKLYNELDDENIKITTESIKIPPTKKEVENGKRRVKEYYDDQKMKIIAARDNYDNLGGMESNYFGGNFAKIRGSKMVIQYKDYNPTDTFGILKYGVLAGKNNELAEAYYKSLEPPAHDEQTIRGSNVEDKYKVGERSGYQSCFQNNENIIKNVLKKLFYEGERLKENDGPSKIKKLFDFGSLSGGNKKKYSSINTVKMTKYEDKFKINFNVKLKNNDNKIKFKIIPIVYVTERSKKMRSEIIDINQIDVDTKYIEEFEEIPKNGKGKHHIILKDYTCEKNIKFVAYTRGLVDYENDLSTELEVQVKPEIIEGGN